MGDSVKSIFACENRISVALKSDWSRRVQMFWVALFFLSVALWLFSQFFIHTMTKRRLEDEGFANVLRQKPKEDLDAKQQIGKEISKANWFERTAAQSVSFSILAQKTFALLMNAQKRSAPAVSYEPSYKYFNTQLNSPTPTLTPCFRCSQPSTQDKCTFCENTMCQNCLQQCSACQYLYCSACSILE